VLDFKYRNPLFYNRKMVRPPSYSLLTLEKGLRVLELIADNAGDIGVTQLSAQLDQPVTVIFRILRTFVSLGYVNQDPRTKRYSLGLRVWELSEKAVARLDIIETIQPVLTRLTHLTGETSSLALNQGTDFLYVATVNGLQPLRAYVEPGARIPLTFPTASGRAILAFSPQQIIDELLVGKLRRFTPKTVVDPSKLHSILEEIRRKGVSIVHGENQQPLSAVAAPIIDTVGRCIGALAMSGVTQVRFEGKALDRIIQLVKTEAEKVNGLIRNTNRRVNIREMTVNKKNNKIRRYLEEWNERGSR
jgi:IclR family KDG regulon transcriptional repressor